MERFSWAIWWNEVEFATHPSNTLKAGVCLKQLIHKTDQTMAVGKFIDSCSKWPHARMVERDIKTIQTGMTVDPFFLKSIHDVLVCTNKTWESLNKKFKSGAHWALSPLHTWPFPTQNGHACQIVGFSEVIRILGWVSSHANRVGFICQNVEIFASTKFSGGDWNFVCVAHGIEKWHRSSQLSFFIGTTFDRENVPYEKPSVRSLVRSE